MNIHYKFCFHRSAQVHFTEYRRERKQQNKLYVVCMWNLCALVLQLYKKAKIVTIIEFQRRNLLFGTHLVSRDCIVFVLRLVCEFMLSFLHFSLCLVTASLALPERGTVSNNGNIRRLLP